MISDVVFEQIIKKKFESKDCIKTFGYIFLCLILPMFLVFIIAGIVGIEYIIAYGAILMLVFVGLIALAIKLIRNNSYEYEYLFVNGELTVDKIIAKSKRSRMINFDVKLTEEMGIYEPSMFAGDRETTVLVYSDTYSGDGDLYMVFRHPTIGKTALVIKSSDRLGKALKPYVKRSIHKEVFPDV